MSTKANPIESLVSQEYKYGFTTEIETESVPPGLSEEIIRMISAKKKEPDFMLQWRLNAYRYWASLEKAQAEPKWANVHYPPIDYQSIVYYSAPKMSKDRPKSLDEVDPELLRTYEKLGIPLREQEALAGVAVDAVFDSVSVATTFKEKLAELGIIFCSFSDAVQEHPDLVQKYLGSVVPYTDNFFAALNSAVFSDGSFVYVPKGVRCPMELSTYFRINARKTGQFERTLIIADEGAYVSYLEGCLVAGEQVSLGAGWVNIESIKPGDFVIAEDGRKARVRAVMVRPYRGDVIKVRPISSHNAFTLTPEHPILCVRRADIDGSPIDVKPSYVPVGELCAGDFIVFPKVQAQEYNPNFSREQLRLLGYYLAEGRVSAHLGHDCFDVSFCFDESGTERADEVKKLIHTLTGIWPSVAHQRKDFQVSVCSTELARFCLKHAANGAAKQLSEDVMALPPEQIAPMLDAYFACAGNSEMRCVTTDSQALARQIQELLARIGIYATIREWEDKVVRFTVAWSQNEKMSEVRDAGNYFLVPIEEITHLPYDGFVFNLDVDGPNSYLVRGFALHNCTAPMRDENQLHAAVVELIAHDNATIKYSTVQNWYPGDKEGRGGIYNFVTKRGKCLGRNSKISWTQVETGSAITWKYPSCILQGDNSVGEFYSVALTNNYQQADTGTKMIHIGKNTRSTIISKGISAGHGQNTYRGLVKIMKSAQGARNYSQCDSLLLGDKCGAHTFPYLEVKNASATVEHEATTSKIGEDQIFYFRQRGLSTEDAVSMIVNGFCKQVIRELPMEFAVEAQKLLGVSLEGSVG
jgi:Fe-S cluster assembly protein SufB